MTQNMSTTSPPAPGREPGDGSSTTNVARDQAADVAGSTRDAGQHVASVAREEVGNVASEATRQARDIAGQARDELGRQAADQQQRVAGGLRSLGSELGSMAERSEEPGVATDLARQASAKAHEVAEWLEQRDPSSLLGEVSAFARRRPGTFLAVALVAGVAAGRLTRGLKDDSSDDRSPSSTPPSGTPGSTDGYSDAGYSDIGGGYAGTGPVSTDHPAGGFASPYAPVPGDEIQAGDEVVEVVEVIEPVYPAERMYDGDGR